MFEEYREPAYAPPPLLKRMVLAGRLGRKSGQRILHLLTRGSGVQEFKIRVQEFKSSGVRQRLAARDPSNVCALCLNSRSSGAHPGSTGASSTRCNSARASSPAVPLEQGLGEEEVRRGAVRRVGERAAQVLFRFRPASAEQARDLEVPAAQRPVGRSLLKGGIDLSTVRVVALMSPRYFKPWRSPNDSASAPMLAASQKCPSGRSG